MAEMELEAQHDPASATGAHQCPKKPPGCQEKDFWKGTKALRAPKKAPHYLKVSADKAQSSKVFNLGIKPPFCQG